MKLIQLNKFKGRQNYFAQVDDDDYDYLNQFDWSLIAKGGNFYAERTFRLDGKRYSIRMHRELLNAKKGQLIDHKDRNGLNNQRLNIRFATESQNRANSKKQINTTSIYKGVSFQIKICKTKLKDGSVNIHHYPWWASEIHLSNRKIFIGYFKSEENAAIAYNIFAEKYHGEFANYNKA